MKSFNPKTGDGPSDNDPGGPGGPKTQTEILPEPNMPETAPTIRKSRNVEIDFPGQRRSNSTHVSTTDLNTRLYKKSPGAGAVLCFVGHALMENRTGLIVQGDLMLADGHVERRAALDMIHRHSPGSTRRLTLGLTRPSIPPIS